MTKYEHSITSKWMSLLYFLYLQFKLLAGCVTIHQAVSVCRDLSFPGTVPGRKRRLACIKMITQPARTVKHGAREQNTYCRGRPGRRGYYES